MNDTGSIQDTVTTVNRA